MSYTVERTKFADGAPQTERKTFASLDEAKEWGGQFCFCDPDDVRVEIFNDGTGKRWGARCGLAQRRWVETRDAK